MKLITNILARCDRFRRDETGSTTVEFVLMFPLLVWCLLATVSYFDAYRSKSIAHKATITLADMVSRETDYITPTYLDNMRELLGFFTKTEATPDFRLTILRWDEEDTSYQVRWSRVRGVQEILTTDALNAMQHKLPLLEDGQRAILFETWSDYVPQFNYDLGLREIQFENSLVLTPRFTTQICWNSDPALDPTHASC